MIIKNGKVLLFKKDDVVLENKDILVQNGKIVKIEDNIQDSKEEVIDAINKIVMPGLINTHTHIAMCIFRATFEGCNLFTWLNEKIWPIEETLTKEDIYNASLFSIVEMISTGTTCFNDQYFMPEETRRAVEQTGIRAMLTRPLMDSDGNDIMKKVDEFRSFYESRNPENDLITYSVSPHGLYTCSGNCLAKARELALEYNLPIHIHFLESVDEIETIKELHKETASNVLKRYFQGIHTILAHGVKITDEDIRILKTMDCGIAHNPVSNLRLGCKIADITKYNKENILVALGTDGAGSGNNLDMFEALRTACLMQGGIYEDSDRITSKDVIKMATINGAKLLGIEDRVGSLEEGKDADIILVDISEKLDHICMLPNNDLLSNLVYNTSGRDVDTTIVKGNVIMKNRKFQTVDVDDVIQRINQRKIEK